ncbi:MAG TPA: DUF4175 family protein [Vicinamibacterales bacterium]|jgi:flagellar biosynthesis chaperone FliJ
MTPRTELTAALGLVRRRWFRLSALNAAAQAMFAIAVIATAAWALGREDRVGDEAALALGVLAAAAALGAVAVCTWRLRRRPDDASVARFVEERFPECGDAIVTAVDLAGRSADAGDFAPLVAAGAAHRLRTLDLDAVVDSRAIGVAALRAAGAAVVCAAALAIAAPYLQRLADIAYVRLSPGAVVLTVTPGDLRVAAGKPAIITAAVRVRARSLAHVSPQITLDAGGETITLPMERAGGGYQLRVPSVDRSFHYRVSAGPAVSRAYSVTALHAAHVERIDLQYDFPAFTSLPPRFERDGGDVYAPAGTRVRVLVHTDKPVRTGALAFSQGRGPATLGRLEDRTMVASITVAEEGAYRVGLIDADGLASESVEYFVRVIDDRPPDVHILRPGNDEGVTSLQEVPIEAGADDDFGIARMELVYSVAGGTEQVVPFTAVSGGPLARVGSRTLAVEDLKVKPGDVIAYYARAWDVPRAKPSTMATSEIFFLEVQPFNEEYSLAVSQSAMQAAIATQLEGLISAQKEIISATWNLERRSAAGRSSTDVKGVADAQIELKGRAERAAGAEQERRRIAKAPGALAAGRQTPQPAAASDPVRAAVEAMGHAAEQLQGQQTAGAMPHEMAALNALLRAQSEIREHQVAQQQSGAGNPFGNRNQVDLSSLFDRELKRQQKSNYEDKAPAGNQQEPAGVENALDRIRDLARRQEELSRQQRDLARGGTDAGEAARQLERLTREQEALRRQLQDAVNQQTRGGRPEPDLADALQQMRDAAAGGQQADASAVAARGQQAAEALRRAEAQLQTGTPNARKRALGDLQLESQQVAEEQRRIAGEAGRLDQEGGGAADARRRLAGDKDRLADRVDALQESAGRLPAAGEAARSLSGAHLGRRMRETARQLRDGHSATSAPAEQQMAEALDGIARRLGAAGADGAGGEAQGATAQTAADLDELRDARDRIARLERQMRDLQHEGGQRSGGSDRRGGAGDAGVNDLQRRLDQELSRTRDLLDRLPRADAQSGGRGATPEAHEWSHSAPGTEAFKQDYGRWQSLTAEAGRALERAERTTSARLSSSLARDRLAAGGSERVPDAYRRQVSRYFEAIAAGSGGGR